MASDAEAAGEVEEPALKIAAAADGGCVALVEDGRVLVLSVPDLEATSEIGLAGGLADHDVQFAGDAGRLVVLDRREGHAVLHVVDPAGPTKLGELRLTPPARILAVAGPYVLVTSGNSTAVIDIQRPTLAAPALPLRGTVVAAGRGGAGAFLIAAGGALEQWDGETRKPGRRLRLDRPLDPEFLGGNARKIWLVPRGALDRLDLITLESRLTRQVELPEPIAHIDAHPDGDVLAAIGAETSSVYLVHVTGEPSVVRLDQGPVVAAAWAGRGHTLLLKPRGAPVELVTVGVPARRADTVEPPPRTAPREAVAQPGAAPVTQWSRDDISRRMAAWRSKFSGGNAPAGPEPQPALPADARHAGGWRAEVVAWSRAQRAGSHREPPLHALGTLDEVGQRLGLAPELRRALALLYGAHLGGSADVALVELAAAIGWNWPEAVGGGVLAASGALRWRRGRVALVREVTAALDELPARTGDVIAASSTSEAAVAIVAPSSIDPSRVGAWAAPSIGALLVPNARGERRPERFLLEARVRGLAPLVPWQRFEQQLRRPPLPSAVVVEHATAATLLELPVVATWPEAAPD